ncbi:MAG: phosphotransferase [Saprospiraceae bacterium]|nr:phosphotransferase [Saprospiraceae bacterium]
MEFKTQFAALSGNAIYLEDDIATIEDYLSSQHWLKHKEQVIRLEKPGEGNMNFVRRIITNQRTFILKQARPWVEKYPQIAAPLERISVEMQFYRVIQQDTFLTKYTPQLLYFDTTNYALALEDLGESADYTFLYEKDNALINKDLESLIQFLNHLHHQSFSTEEKKHYPSNQVLKTLNHEHIFHFPYLLENGFDLNQIQPGLQETALRYKHDQVLREIILDLGEIYLGSSGTLLHGDYYPGSWLRANDRVYVIDPEFSYFGRAEFDLGVFLAHLKMAQLPESTIQKVKSEYQYSANFDEDLSDAFSGVEMLRRIIGLAQLPLDLNLKEKQELLEEARALILG